MEETVYHSSQSALSSLIFGLHSAKPQTSPRIGPIWVSSTLISVMAASRRSFRIWAFHLICFSCGCGSARGKTHDNNNFSSWHSDCCISLRWLISYLSPLPPCSNLISFWALPVISDLVICCYCLPASFFHTSTGTWDSWAWNPMLAAALNDSTNSENGKL